MTRARTRLLFTLAAVAALSSGCSPDIVTSAGTAAELKRQELQSAKQNQDKVLNSMAQAQQKAAESRDRAQSVVDEER